MLLQISFRIPKIFREFDETLRGHGTHSGELTVASLLAFSTLLQMLPFMKNIQICDDWKYPNAMAMTRNGFWKLIFSFWSCVMLQINWIVNHNFYHHFGMNKLIQFIELTWYKVYGHVLERLISLHSILIRLSWNDFFTRSCLINC